MKAHSNAKPMTIPATAPNNDPNKTPHIRNIPMMSSLPFFFD
jgi:hypothetical protein